MKCVLHIKSLNIYANISGIYANFQTVDKWSTATCDSNNASLVNQPRRTSLIWFGVVISLNDVPTTPGKIVKRNDLNQHE